MDGIIERFVTIAIEAYLFKGIFVFFQDTLSAMQANMDLILAEAKALGLS